MGQRTGWRRWPVGRLVAVGIMGVVALLARPASGQEHGEGLLPPGEWSDEQEHELLDLIDRTEQVLPAQFADLAEAEAMGFVDSGTVAPGGYYHYFNIDWLDDDHVLDPEHPESLVYQVTWDEETGESDPQLVAAMFMLSPDHDMTNIPGDIAWMPGWHVHPDLCFDDDFRFTGFVNQDGTCTSGQPLNRPPMLHVWIVDTECGHRFGGVDVGGLHCDVHGGPHDPHDPHDPGPHDPGPHDPHDPGPHDPDPHGPTPTPPGHGGHGGGGSGGGHGHGGGSPTPARPIPRQPNFTG